MKDRCPSRIIGTYQQRGERIHHQCAGDAGHADILTNWHWCRCCGQMWRPWAGDGWVTTGPLTDVEFLTNGSGRPIT